MRVSPSRPISALCAAALWVATPAVAMADTQDPIGDWLKGIFSPSAAPAEQAERPSSNLPPAVAEELRIHKAAATRLESEKTAFWTTVTDKRAERRRKRGTGEAVTAADYIYAFPPQGQLPTLGKEAAAALAEEQRRDPPRPVLTVEDALAAAQSVYRFVPVRISEPEFKRRYAVEALGLGLTADQVLRVYALETGGIGTADMQAGINPITRQGRAISTALGYAQLLHANSVSELVKHGDGFIARLGQLAAARGVTRERRAELEDKIRVLRAMLVKARTVPNEWSVHMRFAATTDGIGIHALNLDGDIGPWLQVIKLDGIRKLAADNGRPSLTGAQLELMNLAGPGTGLEMMTPVGAAAPTTNFFSRAGYERNSVVRGRTGAELLAELDKRMDGHLTKPGAVEFARIFDEVARTRLVEPSALARPTPVAAPSARAVLSPPR